MCRQIVGDPIMGLLKIWLHGQNLVQRFDRLSVLETLSRAPQDDGPSPMSLRQPGSSASARRQWCSAFSSRVGRGSKL